MRSLRILTTISLVLSMACIPAAISSGEQTAAYAAGQEKKSVFLAEVKENMGMLHSCLSARYRPLTKPDQNAIAASSHSEVTTTE